MFIFKPTKDINTSMTLPDSFTQIKHEAVMCIAKTTKYSKYLNSLTTQSLSFQ